MSFLADTTDIEAAFGRVVDGAEKSMAAAAGSVDQFTVALSGIEPVIANSRSDVDKWNEEIMRSMGEAGEGVKVFSSTATNAMGQVQDAGDKMGYSFHEARGGIMLLTEEVGIHLPRELMMLLSHIPLVGSAFSAMLPIIGVVAAIKVIGDLIEKHEKLAEAERHAAQQSETLEIKQNDLREGLAAANLQLEDQIRKLEGRPAVNTLVLALMAVKKNVDDLATTYATDFQKMDKVVEDQLGLWESLKRHAVELAMVVDQATQGSVSNAAAQIALNKNQVEQLNAVIAAEDKLDRARRTLADADPSKDMEGWKAAAGAVAIAAGSVQKAADAAHAAVQAVTPDAAELLGTLTDKATTAKGEWQAMAEKIKSVGLEARKANQEIANTGAEKAAKDSKQALDTQLEQIKTVTTGEHDAYEARKISLGEWLAAEVRAKTAVGIANEDYLKKLVEIYTRAGEVEKAAAEQGKLDILQSQNKREAADALDKALDKQRAAFHKLTEEYGHLIDAGVAKDFEATAKAAEQLTRADDELLKAQSKLAEDKLTQHYKDQEAAITKLAAMHLITEEQKDDRLKLLEQQQANAAIAILDAQLAKEEAAVRAAAAKLAEVKLSPGVSPAAVIEAEVQLKKLETAVAKTEDQIVQTREKFNKQSEADDKSHYGRALLIAMAAGAEMLAEQLKQNHADLLAEQSQLRQAKARGENTAAIEKQITALKQHEQVLEKEANGNKQVILEEQKVTQIKLRAAQAILDEGKARGLDTTAIEKEIRDLQLLLKAQQQEITQLPHLKTGLQGVALATEQMKDEIKQTAQQMDTAFASAIMGALTIGKSIGQAMEQATATVLKNLATQALAHALYFTAMGIAELATGVTDSSAAEWFAAAAEMGLVAGAAGAVGIAMSGGGSGSSATQQAPSIGQSSSSGSSGGGSNQTTGVTHLAAGGIVSKPTEFVAGDSSTGGDAEEAILPLSDPSAMRQVAKAMITGLLGTRDAGEEFPIGEASKSPSHNFPLGASSAPTVGQALGFTAAPSTPSPREAAGFTSGEPAPGEKPAFTRGEPSESEQSEFLAAQPSVSTKPGFDSASAPTVGEALGFKFDTPYPGEKPVFHASEPSAPEKPGFSLSEPSAGQQRDFEAARPQTVGDALGFGFSQPSPSYPGLGFTSGQPSTTAKPGFGSGVASPHEKQSLDFSQPSAGDRPGFDYSAPSLPREMPDMESLAAQFGGLLSQPTLRAASNAQVPAAAVSASAGGASADVEARMEKLTARLDSQQHESAGAGAASGDTTHIHVNVKGLMDAGNLKKVIAKQNRMVQNRQVTIKATDSLRVTRRSQ
jgi:hypothetical protein